MEMFLQTSDSSLTENIESQESNQLHVPSPTQTPSFVFRGIKAIVQVFASHVVALLEYFVLRMSEDSWMVAFRYLATSLSI